MGRASGPVPRHGDFTRDRRASTKGKGERLGSRTSAVLREGSEPCRYAPALPRGVLSVFGAPMILRDLQALFPLRTALRPREVCDTLGIGLTLFYALAKQGKLKVRKIGRVSVVSLADLAAYLDQTATSGCEREAC